MHPFFSSKPLPNFDNIYAALRILTGALMAYHGFEVFKSATMAESIKWMTDDLHMPAANFLAYLGKGAEFVGGISLMLGLYTRLGALAMTLTMLGVCFWMGHGKFWYEDQHPFLFVVLGVLFFFGGARKWCFDKN